jgi:hypothetical protein
VTPNEYLGWLQDLQAAQGAIEKVGAAAGLNRARSEPPGRSGRRPVVRQIDESSFRVHGVVNKAAVSAEMQRATAEEITRRMRD